MCKLAAVIVLRGQYLKEELLASFVQFCILEDWNHIHFIFAAGTQNFPVSARKTGVSKRKEKMVFVECFLHLSSLMSVKPPHLFCLNMS